MFLALGVGAYTGAVFHVMTHAFFKALLFLGAGSIIHSMSGEQDLRNMGGLKKSMGITHVTFLLGCISIAGMPPLAGFISKDEILAHAFARHPALWVIGIIGAMMTAFYMFRLYAMAFLGDFRGTAEQQHHLHESPAPMTIPLIILAILSVIGGWIGIPEIFINGGHRLETFLEPVFRQSNIIMDRHILDHSTEYILITISVIASLAALIFALNKYRNYKRIESRTRGIGNLLNNKWYVDEIYESVIVNHSSPYPFF